MRLPLAALLVAFAALPANAQLNAEAAPAGAGGQGVSIGAVRAIPAAGMSLAPSVALAPPAASLSAALPASALIPLDPKALPDGEKLRTPEEWNELVAATPGEGAKAILRSMSNGPAANPVVRVALSDGETLDGRFRGLDGDRMVFESAGKLIGLDRKNLDVTRVSRMVDVLFDGGDQHLADVVVHDRPAVADPFKDLAPYAGRVVDMDIRDLDDLELSRRTVSGRITGADGGAVELEGDKGRIRVAREYYRIDSVSLRTEHYATRGQIATISAVNGKIRLGAPVELTFLHGKPASGFFRGVRDDGDGDYLLLEMPNGNFRGFKDFTDLTTPGYEAGGLLPGGETLYARPGNN